MVLKTLVLANIQTNIVTNKIRVNHSNRTHLLLYYFLRNMYLKDPQCDFQYVFSLQKPNINQTEQSFFGIKKVGAAHSN